MTRQEHGGQDWRRDVLIENEIEKVIIEVKVGSNDEYSENKYD